MKIPNPKIGSEGNDSKRMKTQTQYKKTRKDRLELLAEATSSILHIKLSI